MAVQATTYEVTVTLKTANGRVLWTLTTTVETPDSTVTLRVPQKLYDLIVSSFGTDTFTTPFTIPLAHGVLMLSVTSASSGLTIKFVPVLPGEVVVDGRVDIVDAATLAYSYGRGPGEVGYSATSDFNIDGRVDILDATLLAMNYGLSYQARFHDLSIFLSGLGDVRWWILGVALLG